MLDKFKIGHYTDAENGTGVTVILAEDGAVAGVSVRGASPATRETDLLKSEKTVDKINAVTLSGGSAFGLEASCGVMEYLAERKIGYKVNDYHIPIVVGASVYDMEYKNFAYPDKAAGYEACKNASVNNFACGSIGGGTGATVGKLCGMEFCAKGGFGVETYDINGIEVAVVIIVNALGDIVDNGKIIAGMKRADGSFADSIKLIASGGLAPVDHAMANTTIGCVLTNAKLTKVQANIIADLAHDGLATAISPSHSPFDGDAVFCMASGEKDVDFIAMTSLIPRLTHRAIVRAVKAPSSNLQKKVSENEILEFCKKRNKKV